MRIVITAVVELFCLAGTATTTGNEATTWPFRFDVAIETIPCPPRPVMRYS